ncbi:keratin-associated protein 9-1-like isoform X2 [Mizuhopecten yessoensis]|uniref:keratin-associated protein 9-1-like isoform X2 n=1 Tax=Mizuhopecten yessoensis TaxID=6573 RepID=UPI000B45C586|nr:keratin-associated protein 9-1-like isoform X2 [Mizuhopecten yessoensis]
MVYMNVRYLVIVLSFAVVRCANPVCSGTACSGTQACKWTCENGGSTVVGANRTACAAVNDLCGTTKVTSGKCKAACVEPAGTPVCTAPACTSSETCKWTCDKSGAAIPGADLDACVALNTACGSTTQTGQCNAACVSTTGSTTVTTTTIGKTGKNGSIRHGLSPLMLICGFITKLILRP